MATRQYERYGAYGKLVEKYFNQSNSNIVVIGGKRRVIPVESPHSFTHAWVTLNKSTIPNYQACQAAESPVLFPFTTEMENEIYNRFVGKLHKGGASLGVTLASWKQSRDMIVDRFSKLNPVLSAAEYRLRSRRRSNRPKAARARASDVLEFEFGWRPLVSDIQAALTTVCKDGIPPQHVKVSQKFNHYESTPRGIPGNGYQTTITGQGRITASAMVSISNPNLWLLNRMGLINPGTVAWDLVPWSFVVNMFVNVNTLIESVSAYAGLTFGSSSITRSSVLLREQNYLSPNPPGTVCETNTVTRIRNRTVGSVPSPRLEFKVPELNWELALIASSLAVQKFRRISELLR